MLQLTMWMYIWATLALLGGGLGLLSCGDGRTDRHAEDSSPVTTTPRQESPSHTLLSQGRIFVGRDLGMIISGEGIESETRSLEALEHQILSFLPPLQEVYDEKQGEDPGLMGSLEVQMTIEPNGTVSDLRFPIKRVSSEKLTTAVYDQMRGWMFLPAALPVNLRYRLLFVPQGLEAASIFTWEKRLFGHSVAERTDSTPSFVPESPVVGEQTQPRTLEKTPLAESLAPSEEASEVALPEETAPRKSEGTSSERRSVREKKRSSGFVPTWYEVTRPSVLYATPDVTAAIVTRLPPGKRVWVVKVVNNDWLEVRSVGGRPPGFLPRETARPEQRAAR